MNLITKKDFYWNRNFASGPLEYRRILIKAGAPVELIRDKEGVGTTAFLNPAYFKEGTIEYNDAATHGCRIAPDNYYSELKKASRKEVSRTKKWLSVMGGAAIGIMAKLTRPSEYDSREYMSRMREVDGAPLSERKENAAEWLRDIKNPGLIAERVDWLLDGNYGYMEYYKGLQILDSPRMNRVAALSMMIAALEWKTPSREAAAAWKKLSIAEQESLKLAIEGVIESHEEKWRRGEV